MVNRIGHHEHCPRRLHSCLVCSHLLRTLLLETMACAGMADGDVTEGELETLAAAYNNLAQSRASFDHIRSIQQSVTSLGLQVRMTLSLPFLLSCFSKCCTSSCSRRRNCRCCATTCHRSHPTVFSTFAAFADRYVGCPCEPRTLTVQAPHIYLLSGLCQPDQKRPWLRHQNPPLLSDEHRSAYRILMGE